ncbi:HAMP domain-containing sensor histidine kinase [Prevotella sp. tf2-5]|uniref:ATP-binding protein n=1 Tax=Prevotella sp. tf2-5 TaxID=1761889 RepID=UPI0015A5E41B|nr:HAMP domain-containing sensor histidine kinase [Prevotella sp. tf2-5]
MSITLTSCQSHDKQVSNRSTLKSEQDSIIQALIDKDMDSALLLIDSLKDQHLLPEYKANYFRGQIHYRLGQELTAELYYKRALTTNELYKDRPSLYYFVSDQLSTILTVKGDQDGAVKTATEAYSIVQKDTTQEGQYWSAILLHDIGYSEMQLGHYQEAKKNFTQAWKTLKEIANKRPTFDNLYTWARITYNIIDAYTSTEQFVEAKEWLPQAEEAINHLSVSPECPATTAEEFSAGLDTHKALVYVKTGQRADARQAYQRFIGTNYSKTSQGLIEHYEYLQLAERWDDLALLIPKVDSVIQSWDIPLSLYYLKSYLTPYLKAYIKTGHSEQALQMAERVVNSIDSIYTYEQLHNAAELAIMYETQEKEKQISEQQSMLKYQRYIAVFIAILLILISFVIITLLRLRNAKKLSDKNKELQQKNKELTNANARAEESSRMKTDFIQQISHEIRTPLNVLSGFTQVLTSTDSELSQEERKDINERITKNTNRIIELVNKMLELSDMHSKSIIERSDKMTTVHIATQAVEKSDIPNAKHVTFHLEYNPSVEKIIRTNFQAASRALALLLNNAVKFTKQGSIELSITLDTKNHMVVYTVTDTGIGIPPYEAEHIFEEFFQLDPYYEGTGIGLSVARSIALRLGGNIYLDTSYQGGARFVFTIPDEA